MAKVNSRMRVWNDTRTDCMIYLPGAEIDGDDLRRAVEQGFNAESGVMEQPAPAEEAATGEEVPAEDAGAKAAKPVSTKALKAAPENK